jgi:hypothetical protein
LKTNNANPTSKSNLRLVTEKTPERVQLSGLEPACDMLPGEYLAQCVNAFLERSKNRAVLEFTIVEGSHSGTAVTEFIPSVRGKIQPRSRYAKECAAALGRDLEAADDLDPAAVFKDKIFRVEVGWRKSALPGGGKNSDEFAQCRKDGRDFLRVHRIMAPGDL